MSQICGEGRDIFIRILSPIKRVPVQDQGSKVPCVKFGAMKIIPSDCLHQEYLTIDLGNNSDSVRDGGAEVGPEEQIGGEAGLTNSLSVYRECRSRSNRLPIHVLDTACN